MRSRSSGFTRKYLVERAEQGVLGSCSAFFRWSYSRSEPRSGGPSFFIWPDFGPLAGAPVGLGTLSLFGAWVLGLRAAQKQSLPSWLRPLPLALLGLSCLLLFVTAMTSPWPLVAAVFAPFVTGWILLAYGIWSLATFTSLPHAPDALV